MNLNLIYPKIFFILSEQMEKRVTKKTKNHEEKGSPTTMNKPKHIYNAENTLYIHKMKGMLIYSGPWFFDNSNQMIQPALMITS